MTYPLTIIPPLAITPAMLTATDVPETDHAEWSSGTTYALGDRVIVAAQHKVFQSLAASNTNNNPATSPTKWIEVGPTNRWKLLDLRNSSATTQALSMSYTITPGKVINSIAAVGVLAQEVTITVTDPVDGVVYTREIDLRGAIQEPTWYAYFFDELELRTEFTATDLPAYGSADIEIEFAAATGDVSCASLLIGYKRSFGLGVESGASVGITDYSRKEPDDFGNYQLMQRAYSRRFELSTLVGKSEVQPLINFLAANRATPMLWIGHPSYASTVVFGFYKDFDVTIDYPDFSNVVIDVEGLT